MSKDQKNDINAKEIVENGVFLEETELDKILELPENHKVMEDGSILYGCTDEPRFFSKEYFRDIKNGLQMVWQAKNPFNDHRSVLKAGMPLVYPDMYRIFFPFSYLTGLIAPIFTRDKDARRNALYNFFGSSLGEIILLSLFGLIVCGVAILWVKVLAPLFQ